MKFSVDIKEASAVVYRSVVCRHNLATVGCKSEAADILEHTVEQICLHTGIFGVEISAI
jgi:hypothetical protein